MSLYGMGERLKMLRQERGYTQKQLSVKLGVTEQAISKWEKERSYPDISILNGIAEALDCSLDYLFEHESGTRGVMGQDGVENRAEIRRHLLPDIISLSFGSDLVPLFLEEEKQGFPHIKNMRCQIAEQWGVIIPAIRIMDEATLPSKGYSIWINGICMEQEVLENETDISELLEKLKAGIFHNIEKILNNQAIGDMIENLRAKYPYVVEHIVPEQISYSLLRQVLVCLLCDYQYRVNPLILIIESIENHMEIKNLKELAGAVAKDLGKGFRMI